ncbi:MAG: amidohydrolase [Erysipelotrichaceae bacterium]|jgi:amidohydrolase|nr:amidohydrolase [Erysipelotrichaceae bacterium]
MDLDLIIKGVEEYVIEQRRYFHENPELSWQEFNTSKRIKEELDKMNIPYETGCKTAVIASIKGKKKGKVLGIRADIDALPVEEKTGLSYASKTKGVMHACGHDAHAAILLGTAKVLNEIKDQLSGEVRLIFQPAEEDIAHSGAKCVLENMELAKGIYRIISLHVMANVPSFKAELKSGPVMASSDTFDIYITGKGGHGAMPSEAIDPVLAGSMVVSALQTFVSRENNPLETSVITVASFNTSESYNVIPETAHLKGTTRNTSNVVRDGLEEKMRRILNGVALTTRCKIELDYHPGSPATINDLEASSLGEKILEEMLGDGFSNHFPTLMSSEDFSRFLREIPGCMMFLGAAVKGNEYPHHNEKFCINEDVFILGVEYFVKYALAYLNN